MIAHLETSSVVGLAEGPLLYLVRIKKTPKRERQYFSRFNANGSSRFLLVQENLKKKTQHKNKQTKNFKRANSLMLKINRVLLFSVNPVQARCVSGTFSGIVYFSGFLFHK